MDAWMTNSQLTGRPLNTIIMPGSHDAGSYDITCQSDIDPGVTPFAKIVPCIVANISKCQSLDIIGQLNAGIRFFDIRIGYQRTEQWLVHGMYSARVRDAFRDVVQWIIAHPKEVFILAVSFTSGTVDLQLLTALIGDQYIAPSTLTPTNNIDDFWQSGRSCIITIDDNYARQHGVWPNSWVWSVWPNKQDTVALKAWCDANLSLTRGTTTNVAQVVLTPTFGTVITGGIPKAFANDINGHISSWLDDWKQQGKALNVILLDFAGIDANVITKIISLNH